MTIRGLIKLVHLSWFGIVMTLLVSIWLIFAIIVAVAPHNDFEMRGFTPCTYQMVVELNVPSTENKISRVIGIISRAYMCYAEVIGEGVTLWLEGKQPNPWANYLFEVQNPYEIPENESEPFSEELLKANLLDDDNEPVLENSNQEKIYDSKD